jgi:hypothetical protein
MYLKWFCPSCNSFNISNDRRHHQLDRCSCKKSFVDFETYGCRYGGEVISTLKGKNKPKELDYNFFDELVFGLKEQKIVNLILLPRKDGTLSLHLSINDVFMIRDLEDEIVRSLI